EGNFDGCVSARVALRCFMRLTSFYPEMKSGAGLEKSASRRATHLAWAGMIAILDSLSSHAAPT
ncbi:MAG TPA: hypothetical protein PKL29_01370, partial [Methanothrix sp.]|nr:hypothetical protein [Methanothrix sp.]